MLREHCHAVWSRIDTEKMKAVHIAHDRLKLRTVAQDFARDHGLELPEGMKPGNSKGSDRFNNRSTQENLGERQQQERTGITKDERVADIVGCWNETTNGSAFVHALEDKGYYLARGDARALCRGGYLWRSPQPVAAAHTRRQDERVLERLEGYPPEKQPDVESAKA